MKQFIIFFIFTVLLSSCSDKNNDEMAMGTIDEVSKKAQRSTKTLSSVDKVKEAEVRKKKIIKDGELRIRVTEIEKTKSRIDSLIKVNDGYYASESFNDTDYELSFSLKVRIPSDNFERFVSDVESGDGEILYKKIDAQDVTDQFIDLKTRLENKRRYVSRYRVLLNKANTIKEILEIEEKIRKLEEEIESTEGRLKYLNDLVAYSTLSLFVFKKKDVKYDSHKRANFIKRLKKALSGGWFGFVDILLILFNVWPLWIVVALAMYMRKRYKVKKRSKN